MYIIRLSGFAATRIVQTTVRTAKRQGWRLYMHTVVSKIIFRFPTWEKDQDKKNQVQTCTSGSPFSLTNLRLQQMKTGQKLHQQIWAPLANLSSPAHQSKLDSLQQVHTNSGSPVTFQCCTTTVGSFPKSEWRPFERLGSIMWCFSGLQKRFWKNKCSKLIDRRLRLETLQNNARGHVINVYMLLSVGFMKTWFPVLWHESIFAMQLCDFRTLYESRAIFRSAAIHANENNTYHCHTSKNMTYHILSWFITTHHDSSLSYDTMICQVRLKSEWIYFNSNKLQNVDRTQRQLATASSLGPETRQSAPYCRWHQCL